MFMYLKFNLTRSSVGQNVSPTFNAKKENFPSSKVLIESLFLMLNIYLLLNFSITLYVAMFKNVSYSGTLTKKFLV